ncbi:hypothetical protein BDV96DRAFT_604429 [Lophiotrema nucula]|uniref:Uncharacterized protein n=1 Tax=Lophiotrema nucula TaxID=690887 RepID=A0A6A5YUW9_9PLEO|nr:hypothetical protein BDV96DRAFT_604429 [Lophiotrema nucula]
MAQPSVTYPVKKTKTAVETETSDLNNSLQELLGRVRAANTAPKPKDSIAGLLTRLEGLIIDADEAQKTQAKAAIESLLVRTFPDAITGKDASSTATRAPTNGHEAEFSNQLHAVDKVRTDLRHSSAPIPIERQLNQAREDGYQNGWKKGKELGLRIGESKGVEKGQKMARAEVKKRE